MKHTIKQFPDKSFNDKMDMVRFIKEKRAELFAIKSAEYKTKSEPMIGSSMISKEFIPNIEDISGQFIEIKSVINTTNVIDSHMDLHLPNIWNKTVSDNPYTYHLKQHKQEFESVLSSRAKNFNERMFFKDLGVKSEMEIDANISQFILDKNKHPFMFDAYKNGDVKQHSVGMVYVSLDIAYYDEDSQKEMDFFNEMKSKAINPEVADEMGYVWVISEAKKREGSAVVFGSNSITPTLWVKNYEPGRPSTQKDEPPIGTQELKGKITFI